MPLLSWLSLAALCVSGAVSPGPSLAVVVKNTVHGGPGQGVATGVGHGLGVGLYAFGAVAGVSVLLHSVPAVEQALTLAGGLYLLWLGVGAWRASGPAMLHDGAAAGGFREGFFMAFLNPKIAVFFLALLSSFVPDGSGIWTRAGVAALALGIDMAWYVGVSLVLVRSGGAAWLAARGQMLNRVTGVVLLAVGLAVLRSAML